MQRKKGTKRIIYVTSRKRTPLVKWTSRGEYIIGDPISWGLLYVSPFLKWHGYVWFPHHVLSKAHFVYMCSFLPVNSYGEDEDLTTSSDSDDEVIKQFEISVSRSQSFRSGVSEKGTQAGSERRPKFNRLLSNHEEYSTEASECEGTILICVAKEWARTKTGQT